MDKDDGVLNILTEEDRAKYEIAEELGLLDKVREGGWKSLTAKESGKIGGLIASRKKNKRKIEKVVDK
ncbi:MAG TPA: small acid-soluble spore protein alpha/beta type [Lachnospiraceae bacterium]|nr:small acid-soluble spore protein alpha/beta type [Lachnospiraceae bacterium]